jgi:Zn-finger nucleic acid-binding protein
MGCPRCGAGLVASSLDGVEGAHLCGACGGWFVEAGCATELAASHDGSDHQPAGLAPQDTTPALHCPLCRNWMHRSYLAGANVYIDACNGHGLFLDHGELERTASYMAQTQADESAVQRANMMGHVGRGAEFALGALLFIAQIAFEMD